MRGTLTYDPREAVCPGGRMDLQRAPGQGLLTPRRKPATTRRCESGYAFLLANGGRTLRLADHASTSGGGWALGRAGPAEATNRRRVLGRPARLLLLLEHLDRCPLRFCSWSRVERAALIMAGSFGGWHSARTHYFEAGRPAAGPVL